MSDLVSSLGEPSYRVDQVYGWLYQALATRFEEMLNLPMPLRQRLEQMADLQRLIPLEETSSASGLTRKVLFGLRDG